MDDLVLRASRMPLAFRCAGSVRVPDLSISEYSEPASLGTAVHEALRPLAEGRGLQWDELPAVASRHGVDGDELRLLCAIAAKLWPQLADSFTDALSEVGLAVEVAPGVTLTGHLDLLAVKGVVARAADWKTGRKDSDYSQQMRAYGALVLFDDPLLTEVTVTIVWLRDAEIENYTVTRESAQRWARELVESVVQWDGTFRPGPHCGYCPRSHECAAANALVRRDVAALADRSLVARTESDLASMTPAEIVTLYRKAGMVLDYAGRVRDAIKAHVAEHGDIVGDETRLTIETEERRELDPVAAWPALEEAGFTDEDFAASMDLRISRVEKRVAQKAGRGQGAAAVRSLGEQLAKAKAVSVREIRKLVEKRIGGVK